jgi:hypothetical protein
MAGLRVLAEAAQLAAWIKATAAGARASGALLSLTTHREEAWQCRHGGCGCVTSAHGLVFQ